MKATLLPQHVPAFLKACRLAGVTAQVTGPDSGRPWMNQVEGEPDPCLKVKPFNPIADIRWRVHPHEDQCNPAFEYPQPCKHPLMYCYQTPQHRQLPNIGDLGEARDAANLAEENWKRAQANPKPA